MNSPAYRDDDYHPCQPLSTEEPGKSPDLVLAYGAPSVDKLHCGPFLDWRHVEDLNGCRPNGMTFSYSTMMVLCRGIRHRRRSCSYCVISYGVCIHTAGKTSR